MLSIVQLLWIYHHGKCGVFFHYVSKLPTGKAEKANAPKMRLPGR